MRSFISISIVAFLLSGCVVLRSGAPDMPADIPQYDPQTRDEYRVQDVWEIWFALRRYYQDQQMYPAGNKLVLGRNNSNCLSSQGFTYWGDAMGTTYLPKVPAREFTYIYTQEDGGRSYSIEFELELGYQEYQAGPHRIGPLPNPPR